ncbi:MAG: esterase/lipase family protein [Acutalibacteraceae bacterium]
MKSKKLISVISLVLSVCLIFSVSVPAFAGNAGKTNYPFIFVHGMSGWGEDSPQESKTPYWGTQPENNVMTYLRDRGYTVYNPAVGAYSSAWDRACELYAKLTGTVVDYGEAHSKKYGHERFGRDYTGKAAMGEPWDLESPLNFVGHSFGGETVRLLASLLAYGDEDEKAACADCSELFKGGHEKGVYSVSTISSPHNGSTVSNYASDLVVPEFIMMLVMHYQSVKGESKGDLMLDQWGLSADPASGEKVRFSPAKCMKLALSGDHCGYDLTVQGAEKLNKKIKTVRTAYYFSYSACITKTGKCGYTTADKQYNIYKMFYLTSFLASASVNMFVGGKFIDKSWGANDGIVPVKSALYPFDEDHITYDAERTLQTGVWYVMSTLMGVDHYDFCSAAETGEFGSREGYFKFYTDLVEKVCNA